MPFSEKDWEKLKEVGLKALRGKPSVPELQGALKFFRTINPSEFAEWLYAVTSPSAADYILSLWEEFLRCGHELANLMPALEKGTPQALNLCRKARQPAYRLLNRLIRETELRMRPQLRVNLLGFGEITRVLDLEGDKLSLWCDPETGEPIRVVFKKTLLFPSREAAEHHAHWYMEYNRLLRDEVGIEVPPFDVRIVGREPGSVRVYMLQGRIDPAQVCVGKFLEQLTPASVSILYRMILKEYSKVYNFNKNHAQEGIQVGIDGQIPNWAVKEYAGSPEALTGKEGLVYLDTTVPMIRLHGQDVINPEIYFQTLPAFAQKLIKALGLHKKVLNRYYNFRTIMLDFVSNFIVRHRPDLVPILIELSNEAISSTFQEENWPPLTEEEVWKYYREDVFIWRLWRSLKLMKGCKVNSPSFFAELHRIWTQPIF